MAESVLDQISQRLPEYLIMQGVHVSKAGFAKCPLHGETDGSFHVTGTVYHCFGCGAGGNIFNLASLLEGLPDIGEPHFGSTTVPTLAERFKIPVDQDNRRASGGNDAKIRGVNRMIYQALAQEGYEEELKSRGYDVVFARRSGIGFLPNYKELRQQAINRYGSKPVKDSGLDYFTALFDDSRMLFTIHDHYGRPVGFSGRRTDKTKMKKENQEEPAKYINSPNSGVFDKSKLLYNMHRAKRYDVVYVMEGQTDVQTSLAKGLPNVVGILSNNVTVEEIEVLKEFDKVILVLDGDKGGTSKTTNLMKLLPNATAVFLPNEMDPDDYIGKFGMGVFLKLEELNHIGWMLIVADYNNRENTINAVRQAAAANPLHTDLYARIIAKRSGMELERIMDGIEHARQDINRRRLNQVLKSIEGADSKCLNLTISMGKVDETTTNNT